MDEEFDIYEDLHLDAILIAAGTEEGGIALPTASPIDPSGTTTTRDGCVTQCSISNYPQFDRTIICVAVGSTPPLSESPYIMRADSSAEADAAGKIIR